MSNSIFREFRERHGLGQKALGKALGIEGENAQSRISHYESERRETPKEIAYRFMDYAKTLGEIYTLEDIYPRPNELTEVA